MKVAATPLTTAGPTVAVGLAPVILAAASRLIPPAVLVIVTVAPADASVANTGSAPVEPITNCPFVGCAVAVIAPVPEPRSIPPSANVIAPVPPFATTKVPAKLTAPAVAAAGVKPVVPPAKVVTPPPPPPPVVIETTPPPSSVKVVLETLISLTLDTKGVPSCSVTLSKPLPLSVPVYICATLHHHHD